MNLNKPYNFPIGTLVTWRSKGVSSWIEYLANQFGPGPFQVIDVDYSLYDNPKVILVDCQDDKVLEYSEGMKFFDKSWLQKF
ncbi:MAG TPA: hypothetical protein PKD79_02495 [Candidatus Doudnabacteria bacterium]|nr:hypothetical protein [Candidatus Doudnabacteria bacterium]